MPSPGPVDRWIGGRGSLQRELLLRTLAVLAVTAVLLSSLATALTRQLVVGQIDQELAATRERTTRGQSADGTPGLYPKGVDLPGQQIGTVVLVFDGQRGRAGVQTEGGPTLPPEKAISALIGVPDDGRKRSVTLPGLGHYRVLGFAHAGNLVVVGLPLAGVDAILYRLLVGEVVLTLLALLGGAVGVRLVVERGLRPLNRLAGTAQSVSALPLGSGEVELAVRVPEADADPRSEVGRVGVAFNRMLAHVGGALVARQASETKLRRFVADASHELRNPLAAISGYAELTRRRGEELPEDARFAVGRIESEAGRMHRLVEDLLLLARLDTGRAPELERVDVSALVVDAVSDARVAGQDHHWRLELAERAVEVRADRFQLQQVLVNLLANARTHTPPGTTVTTAVRVEGSDTGGTAVVTVADDGPGIPAETLPRVFERFTRADSARARLGAAGERPSGTGLGLAIVAAVVEAHRGRVHVHSVPGSTTFTVRLPLAGAPEQEASEGS
ncbi:HAMP domain-containing protein [Desertihabitans brevis]|uniref:histidine kinase n=1 Tax=Desertihabitans brevis TaxID=2268447 RepID=A0A367YW02_9ACTN|nr:HAMP domain-containing sensor histidine kinase [Desertihabitans brevis]RCK70076.1 HAMP domain-containing protein [Desertihabitans brevis]